MTKYRFSDLSPKDRVWFMHLNNQQWSKGCECALYLGSAGFLHVSLDALKNEYYNERVAPDNIQEHCFHTLRSIRAMELLLGVEEKDIFLPY